MLKSVSDIVGDTTEICLRQAKTFLPLAALLFLHRPLLTALGLLGLYLNRVTLIFNPLTNIVILVSLPLLAALYGWASLAMFKTAHSALSGQDSTTAKETLRTTWKLLLPALYTLVLTLLALFFGGLLLVIPGVIFLIWFSFGSNELIAHNKKGFAALSASKALVVGRFWPVAWRIFAPWLTFISIAVMLDVGLSFVLTAAISDSITQSLIGNILATLLLALATPFTITATCVLYKDLQANPATPSN